METGNVWSILGLEPTVDEELIKEKYYQLLVNVNPEDDPEGFKRLRQAYEAALDAARHPEQKIADADEPKDAMTQWINRAETVYWYISTRNNPECWKELLQDPICVGLDTALEARERFLVFLMQHAYISQEIWQLIDRELHIIGEKEELEEAFPKDFLDYIQSGVENKNFFPYEKLKILGEDESEIQIDAYLNQYYNIHASIEREEMDGICQKLDDLTKYEVQHPYEAVETIRVWLYQKEPKKAVELAEKLLPDNAGDSYVEIWSGYAYYADEQWEKARECWQAVLNIYPKNYAARKGIAQYQLHEQQYTEAKELIMELLEENGNDDAVLKLMREVNEPLLESYRKEAAEHPENKGPAIEACWCLFQNERFGEAIEGLETLHIEKDDEEYYDYVNMLSRCYLGQNKYEEALPYLLLWEEARDNLQDDGSEQYRKRRSREGYIKSAIGMTYQKLKDYEKAEQYLLEGSRLEKDALARHSFMDLLAMVYLEKEDYKKCVDVCTEILQEDAGYYPAYLRRQQAYFELQDGQKVVDDYYNAIRIYPGYYKPYLLAARVFNAYRQYQDARKVIDAAYEQGLRHVSLQYLEIRIMRNLAETKEDYARVLELCQALRTKLQDTKNAVNPDEELQLEGITAETIELQDIAYEEMMLYLDMDNEEKALEIIEEQYKLPDVNYRFHWVRADILRDQRKYEAALKEYQYLRKRITDTGAFAYNCGVCLTHMKEEDAALEAFEQTLRIDPADKSAHHKMMEIYQNRFLRTERIEDYRKALQEINAQLELVPDAYYYVERGLLYMDNYEFEPAIADYKKAIELEPDNLYPYNNIGHTLRMQGRYEEAIEYLTKAIELMQDKETLLPFMNLARCYEAMQQWQDGIEILKQATAEFGVKRTVYLAMFDYYMASGDFGNALKCLDTIHDKKLLEDEEYLVKKAKLYVVADDEKQTERTYRELKACAKKRAGKSKEDWQEWADALQERGLYLFYKRDLKHAERALEVSLKLRTKQGLDYETAARRLAMVYYLRHKYAKAEKLADRLIREEKPEEEYLSYAVYAPMYATFRAMLYMCKRDYKRMKELLDRALRVPRCKHCTHSCCTEAWIVWGIYEESQGNVEKALEYYRKGLEGDPLDEEIILVLRHLDKHE